MTYHKQGLIQAGTYNAYAAILNSIYADTNSGSTTESSADYGYGQATTIPSVAVGNNITAAQWTALFSKIHLCGTHQGTSVSPIPASVSAGQLIAAYNDYLTTQTLTDVVSLLIANRLRVNDLSNITGPTSPSSPSWGGSAGTKCLRYQFQLDFGSWDNARYFFNTGGAVGIYGVGTGGALEDIFWTNMLNGMSTLKFAWHDTIPFTGAGSTVGFYDLQQSPAWVKVYERSPVSGGIYYSSNFIAIYGQLVDAPGTSGKVNLKIELVDNDPGALATTAGTISFNISLYKSSIYPGPTVVNNAGTFSINSNYSYTGVPLTVTSSQSSAAASFNGGAGTATTSAITITPAGGTAPYFYSWTKDPLAPADPNLTFSNPSGATSTVSYTLASGQIASTTAKITITDNVSNSTYILIPVSFNSNALNIPGS